MGPLKNISQACIARLLFTISDTLIEVLSVYFLLLLHPRDLQIRFTVAITTERIKDVLLLLQPRDLNVRFIVAVTHERYCSCMCQWFTPKAMIAGCIALRIAGCITLRIAGCIALRIAKMNS